MRLDETNIRDTMYKFSMMSQYNIFDDILMYDI